MLSVIEKSDKPLNRTQVAARIPGDSVGKKEKVSMIIRRLLKKDDIKCIEVDRFEAAKLLGFHRPLRRMRFYYCSDSE